MPHPRPLLERFRDKIVVGEPGDCWEWLGYRDKKGYGHYVYWVGKKQSGGTAHRVSYELLRGDIPETYTIDHLCRNRACVNPFHLEAVPHVVNVRRGTGGAKNREKTHCVRGHPLSGDNVRVSRRTRGVHSWLQRSCRACQRMHTRNYKQRRKAS